MKGHTADEAEACVDGGDRRPGGAPRWRPPSSSKAAARLETAFWQQLASSHGRAETLGMFEIAAGGLPAAARARAPSTRASRPPTCSGWPPPTWPAARARSSSPARKERREWRRRAALGGRSIMTGGRHRPAPTPSAAGAVRRAGPAGSVLIVEEDRSVPIVHVVVASRSGLGLRPAPPRGAHQPGRRVGAARRGRPHARAAGRGAGRAGRHAGGPDRARLDALRGRGAGPQPGRLPGAGRRRADPPGVRARRVRANPARGRWRRSTSSATTTGRCAAGSSCATCTATTPTATRPTASDAALEAATAAEAVGALSPPLRGPQPDLRVLGRRAGRTALAAPLAKAHARPVRRGAAAGQPAGAAPAGRRWPAGASSWSTSPTASRRS